MIVTDTDRAWRMADGIWLDGGARNPNPSKLSTSISSPPSCRGSDSNVAMYQMTYYGPEAAVSFIGMKNTFAYIGGGVIVAIMFLAVFVGGGNAGDCSGSQSADAPAAKGQH